MQCNIDARGKRVRLVSGLATLIVGLVLAVLAAVQVMVGPWLWVFAALAIVGGAFQVFEARKGWCALRAMGIRTPV